MCCLLTEGRQFMCQRNVEARSWSHCCLGKAIWVKHHKCVTSILALVIRHAPSVWLYNIFPHYLTNGTTFGGWGGGVIEQKCVFWFSLQLLSETFLILRRIQRVIITNIRKSSRKVTYFCHISIKIEISREILEKYLNIKLHFVLAVFLQYWSSIPYAP